jgi:Transposase DDE domain
MKQAARSKVLEKLPFAEAVLIILRFIFDGPTLSKLYEAHRGSCYERQLTFSGIVHLICDALLGSDRSVRETLVDLESRDELPCTIRAFYDKLSRTPVEVSCRLVDLAGTRLAELGPPPESLPFGPLSDAQIVLIDGKVIKHVPRRLKETRRDQCTAAKLLGGRGLVAIDGGRGTALAMAAVADGEANEVPCLPKLLENLPAADGRRIFVADRAFGYLGPARLFAEKGHFLLRKHGTSTFVADPKSTPKTSKDRFKRKVVETWGKLVRGKTGEDWIAVRRIEVRRKGSPLILVTDLLDPVQAPANDLLEIYLTRWDIENVFQEVTELFDLKKLVGSTPEANLFQLAITLVMATVVQTIKGWMAKAKKRRARSISTEMLLRDVRRQFETLAIFFEIDELGRWIFPRTADEIRTWLETTLGAAWKPKYAKRMSEPKDPSRPKKAKAKQAKYTKSHDSVFRILQRAGK